jgi:hypothetical protein
MAAINMGVQVPLLYPDLLSFTYLLRRHLNNAGQECRPGHVKGRALAGGEGMKRERESV